MLISGKRYELVALDLTYLQPDDYIFQKNYVDMMEANMGGTVLGGALKAIFDYRKNNIPTSVFVLTDGEVRSQITSESLLTSK